MEEKDLRYNRRIYLFESIGLPTRTQEYVDDYIKKLESEYPLRDKESIIKYLVKLHKKFLKTRLPGYNNIILRYINKIRTLNNKIQYRIITDGSYIKYRICLFSTDYIGMYMDEVSKYRGWHSISRTCEELHNNFRTPKSIKIFGDIINTKADVLFIHVLPQDLYSITIED